MMKNWVLGLVAVGAVVLGASQPAHAGRIFAFAEGAQFTTNNTECTKDTTTLCGTGTCATTIDCNDGGTLGRFQLSVPFPPDAGNSWTYRIHQATTNTGSAVTCSWDVKTAAMVSTAVYGATLGAAVDVTGSNTWSADEIHISSTSSAQTIHDALAGTDCTGTTCQNTEVIVQISLDASTTTATDCLFRMLEIIY